MLRRIIPYVAVALVTMVLTTMFQPMSHLISVAVGQGECRTFPETGKQVCGKFLAYWDSHGGLPQQGYPITGEFTEVSDLNGQPYTVQYFERAIFELHPENAGTPYEVLLSQLGTYRLRDKYHGQDPSTLLTPTPTPTPTPNAAPSPTATPGDANEPPRISLADFKKLYDDPATRPLIIDVRSEAIYEGGHIKGAISFPYDQVDTRYKELPRDKLIVAYCQ